MTRTFSPSRRAVTLVELLVVIAVLTLLATIVIAVTPYVGTRNRTANGADLLQGWLLVAKQRAFRDNQPRGIRLLPPVDSDPTNPQSPDKNVCVAMQYIEEPDVLSVGIQDKVENPSANTFSYYTTIAYDPDNPLIQATPTADIIAYPGLNRDDSTSIFRVTGVSSGTAPNDPSPNKTTVFVFTTDRNMNAANVSPSSPARAQVYRSPRPQPGEPILQLPPDVIIDVGPLSPSGTNYYSGAYRSVPSFNTGGGQPLDIVFDPSGRVVSGIGRTSSRITLWVRDRSLNPLDFTYPQPLPAKPTATYGYGYLPAGDNRLITVYTRTGQIAAHPVDQTNTNGVLTQPFSFTQDPRSSGL